MMLDKSKLSEEDQEIFGILEYQISKLMDQNLVEGVPEIVRSIDDASSGYDHTLSTEDETLYRLPSGTYVEVAWGFYEVEPQEAEERIKEVLEEWN